MVPRAEFRNNRKGRRPWLWIYLRRRTRVRRVSALALLLLAACVVGAPECLRADRLADDRFSHLGAEEGLSGRVLDIAQDEQGFLWFASRNGLHRYDGGRLKTFIHDPDDPHSISDSNVSRLLVDSADTLWIATDNGHLNQALPESEGFRLTSDALGGRPIGIDEVAPGRLLVALYPSGVVQVSTSTGETQRVAPFAETSCLAVDSRRRVVWSFGVNGLTSHSPDDFSQQQSFPWPETLTHSVPYFLNCDVMADGRLWGALYTVGVVRVQPQSGEITFFQHSPDDPDSLIGNDVSAVLEDSSGNIWIGGFSGWNRYLRETGTFRHYTSNPSNRRSLVNQQIHNIFEDQTGQIWLGTDAGAARFDPFREDVSFYSHDPSSEVSAPPGSIRSFTEDDQGRLWVGSRSRGIARMDRERGETIYYETTPSINNGTPDSSAWALSYETPGRLWVGNESGLFRLQVDTGEWKSFDLKDLEETKRIVTLFRDRLGTLWAGSHYGGFRHDPDSDSLVRLDFGTMELHPLHLRVMAFTDDAEGRLLVGMEGAGIAVYDARNSRWLKHWPGEVFSQGQLHEGVISALVTVNAHESDRETIWASTLGGGLYRLEADDTWSRFEFEQSLSSTSIEVLLAEPSGTLWLSTGVETMRLEPSTGALRSFGASDGFPSFIHTKAAFQSRRGEMFFGGLDGFSSFFPDSIRIDETPPRVVLTDFRISNRSMLPRARQPDSPLAKSITVAESVTLRHFQNDFTIELAALHFGDPERNRFLYRLDGVDTDWIETSAERSFARYSGIPAGRHLFRAKAMNRDGVWSREEAQLEVRILPAPWRSWWAWTLYIATLVGFGSWWFRDRMARLELEKELQEQELKVLRGLLPICATCKKIRDDDGEWEPLESYLDSHSDAELTHGICEDCAAEMLAELRHRAPSS